MIRLVEMAAPVLGVARYGVRLTPDLRSARALKRVADGWMAVDVPVEGAQEDLDDLRAELRGEQRRREEIAFPFAVLGEGAERAPDVCRRLNAVLPFLAAIAAPESGKAVLRLRAWVPVSSASGEARRRFDELMTRAVRYARRYLMPVPSGHLPGGST